MMDQLIAEFPGQLLEALVIGEQARLRPAVRPIQQVLVCGLGGSGIGANFAWEFTRHQLAVPFAVSKGYDIPAYVGPNTLVICSSYSGNTEETLYSYDAARRQGAQMVCIASGGQLIARAQADGVDYITLPANKPSPRACLGYSLVQQLVVLQHFGLIDPTHLEHIRSAAALLSSEDSDIRARAERIAQFMHGKFPMIYTTDRTEAVAVRLRQQLNENAKILCCHHVIPEMNHNELVGWRPQNGQFAVLLLRCSDDFERNQARIEVNKEVMQRVTDTIIEVFAKGETLIEKSLYLVYLGDWISWYMSALRGVDAVEVKAIDYLKAALAKL